VTVIDRHNYHLFQPLLYQVATAALSPPDIAQPIRAVLRHQQNATVLLGEVTGVDTAARRVETRFAANQCYDYRVLATGRNTPISATLTGRGGRPVSNPSTMRR
jgi:NADH:quinone reductase (non-electrogenic)